MANLTHLSTLRLCSNPLPHLPEALGSLPGLTTLHATYCQLSTLPSSLFEVGVHALETLALDHNQLRQVPAPMATLVVDGARVKRGPGPDADFIDDWTRIPLGVAVSVLEREGAYVRVSAMMRGEAGERRQKKNSPWYKSFAMAGI